MICNPFILFSFCIKPAFPRKGPSGDGASAEFPDLGYRLEQEGMVTPSHGKGTLQLEAYSTFFIEGQPFLEFLSVGNEVENCPF